MTKIKPQEVTYEIGHPKHDINGRIIIAEYDRFYLVAAYVPYAGQLFKNIDYRTKEWDIDLRKKLESLSKDKPVILAGDLNVCLSSIDIDESLRNYPGYHSLERANFSQFLESGWTDTFRQFNPNKC